jgi:DNA helicase-2/ATP-dependent DNA helicase PcrA
MDLSSLNERQKEAVLYNDGALAVLSSAGSGKTRVITSKIAYLINVLKVRPSRIIACTFTKKATSEMTTRLEPLIGDAIGRLKVGTIHSIAYGILKQAKLMREPTHRMPTILINNFPVLMHLYKFCKEKELANKNAKMYVQEISILKLELYTVHNFCDRKQIDPDSPHKTFNHDMFTVFKEYERWLKKNKKMDFADILSQCYYILKDERYQAFVESLQRRCEYILLDECQDTNTVSFKIINILADYHKNVTIVGDSRQLIYSFQGANMQNLHDFNNLYDPRIVDLNVNYRSTKTIVDNSNKLISFATNVIGEPAVTPNVEGDQISYFTSPTAEDEVESIVRTVQSLRVQGHEWRDIAILYRVHSQSVPIEDQFIFDDIPFITFNNQSFYKRREIKDLIEYMKVFVDPHKMSDKQLKRLCNKPTRFISGKTINELQEYCFEYDKDLYEGIRDVYDTEIQNYQKSMVESFYFNIEKGHRMYKQGASPAQLFDFVIKEVGYEDWAVKEKQEREPDVDITLNFDTIISTVSRYSTPEEFLDFLVEHEAEEKRKKDENGDYIKLMSIHASKGKEFKVVIVLGVCDRLYPFHMAVGEGNEPEERRVMYVAITRPEKKLFLSVVNGKMGRYNVLPSPYMKQMNFEFKGLTNVRV